MATRTRNTYQKRDNKQQRIVTLEDIAKLAGVSAMTVSRVIKGTGGVSSLTREKVLHFANELNYTANLAARSLATGRTGTIAIISGSLNQHYYANVVHLLESQLTASGYQMRLLHTHDEMKDLISSTNASAVDGVIIAGLYSLVEEFRSIDPQIFQPCIYIDTLEHTEVDYIYGNLSSAVEEALGLMLAAGCQRVAYVGNFKKKATHLLREARKETYCAVMETAQRSSELITAMPAPDLAPSERIRVLKEYFETSGCPDGLLCINDETAILALRALMDLGYRVPDDVLLVGCDGLPYMECFEPPLSTISQPMEQICELAWKFLQRRMANPDIPLQQATFNAQLLVRKSLQSPSLRSAAQS